MQNGAVYTTQVGYVKKGADAVSYEIVPSTRSLLVLASGQWADGTTTSTSFAKVTCSVYKIVGSKRELCTEKLYFVAGSAYIKGFVFDKGTFDLMIPRSATIVDVSVFVFDKVTSKPTGNPLAMISIPVIHNGTDGTSGASLLCQYSSNGTGNWHDDYQQGTDFWMHQKLSTDKNWSAPMRIVGEQGVKGKDGSYTEFSYGISSMEATSSPTTSPTDVSEWLDGPQKTTAKKPYLWMTICKFSGDGKEGTRYYVRINGKDGVNGTSINIKGNLANSGYLPTSGAALGDCYLIDGELWVYVGEQEGANETNMKYGFVNCGSIKGEPGASATQYFYHIAWANSITKQEDGSIVAEGFTTSNPAGADYAYMGVCYTTDGKNDPDTPATYKWVKVEGKPAITCEVRLDTNTVTLNEKTGKFITEKLGKFRYIKHVGGTEEEVNSVYLLSNNLAIFLKDGAVKGSLMASGESDIMKFIENSKIAQTDIDMIRFFWYDTMLLNLNSDPNATIIKRIRDAQGIPPADTGIKILASSTFTVLRQPKDGERGSAGAKWRQHKGFVQASEAEPYGYMAGGEGEEFIDVVLVGKVWYRCQKSYQSTGTTDPNNTLGTSAFEEYWGAPFTNADFIATDLFLAENAKINLLGSNEVNLYDSSSGGNETGKLFGSYRVPVVTAGSIPYALWLGAETGEGAPFSVTKGGKIYATAGQIGSFEIVTKKDPASDYVFYSLSAHSEGTIYGLPPCDTVLDNYGIAVASHLSTPGNWTSIGLGREMEATSEDTSINPMYRYGAGKLIRVNGDTSNVELDITGIYVSVTSHPNNRSYAFYADNGDIRVYQGKIEVDSGDVEVKKGDFVGTHRPPTAVTDKDRALTDADYFVVCTNDKNTPITLTLPLFPKEGQSFQIYQAGKGKVVVKSTTSRHPIVSHNHDYPSGSQDFTSSTTNQTTWVIYAQGKWYLNFLNH